MKYLILSFCILTGCLFSQTPDWVAITVLPPGSDTTKHVLTGQVLTVGAYIKNDSGEPINAIEWEEVPPLNTTLLTAKAIWPNSNLQCVNLHCLFSTTQPIPVGDENRFAEFNFRLPDGYPDSTAIFSIGDAIQATSSIDGFNFKGAVGPSYIVKLPMVRDLNGDGVVNNTDAILETGEILGLSSCIHDLDGDGKCTIYDLTILLSLIK